MVEVQGPAEIVIVTGIFGARWHTAIHTMEDLGWYVMDNLSPTMLPIFVDRMGMAEWSAVAADVCSRGEFEQLPTAFVEVKTWGHRVTVLFLEINNDVVVQRQESNRQPLPLQCGGRLPDGIVRERRLLVDLRAFADIVVDIPRLNAWQLAQRISNHFGTDATDNLSVALMSFGFKNEPSVDANIALDARFLPNPYWVPELRPKTGLPPDVTSYVLPQDAAQEFQGYMPGVTEVAAPGYLTESRHQVTVAIGYTGGKHRSTSMTEELAIRLRGRGYGVSVLHRDLGEE